MVWVRVEDTFDEHPKFAQVGPLGIAMWLAGMAYCNRNLTDGFIPWGVAQRLLSWQFIASDDLGQTQRYRVSVTRGRMGRDVDADFVIGLLVEARLWVICDGGYRVHEYEQYQPTRAQVEADRAAKIAAGQAGGKASAIARATARARANGAAHAQAPDQAGAQANGKQNPTPGPGPGPSSSKEVESTIPQPPSRRGRGRKSRSSGDDGGPYPWDTEP